MIEVLIASLLVASAIMTFAHVAAIGVRQQHAARHATSSLSLAQSKLEDLRAAVWAFDAAGTPVSDPALALSSSRAVFEDEPGFVDSLDAFGGVVTSQALVVYRRRWAISLLDPADEHTLLLQSCVYAIGGADGAWSGPPEACVSTIRTRKP